METPTSAGKGAETSQFKSYYVVWKPVNCVLRVDIVDKFKSYYVVWKP